MNNLLDEMEKEMLDDKYYIRRQEYKNIYDDIKMFRLIQEECKNDYNCSFDDTYELTCIENILNILMDRDRHIPIGIDEKIKILCERMPVILDIDKGE